MRADLIEAARRAGLRVKIPVGAVPPEHPEDTARCPRWPADCHCRGKCGRCGLKRHDPLHCGTVGNPTKPLGHGYVGSYQRKPD